MPKLHYPHGYAVRVRGAVFLKTPGGSRVLLLSCPGRATVTVRVSASGKSHSDCALKVVSNRRRTAPRHRRSRRSASFTG
jgi:hypothetical protein